jgi:hypothetical protein
MSSSSGLESRELEPKSPHLTLQSRELANISSFNHVRNNLLHNLESHIKMENTRNLVQGINMNQLCHNPNMFYNLISNDQFVHIMKQ